LDVTLDCLFLVLIEGHYFGKHQEEVFDPFLKSVLKQLFERELIKLREKGIMVEFSNISGASALLLHELELVLVLGSLGFVGFASSFQE
jgi:hypothetical protein